jgi:hypothetical protein
LKIQAIKEINNKSQTLLYDDWVCTNQTTVIGIKERLRFVVFHSEIPLSNNSINNNIENDRRNNISLMNSMPCSKMGYQSIHQILELPTPIPKQSG